MQIIRNDSYNYIISYRRENSKEYRLIGERQTSREGSSLDRDGKCLHHTFQFAGWYLTEQHIERKSDGTIIDRVMQCWKRKDGTKFNIRSFKDKAGLVEWTNNYIKIAE